MRISARIAVPLILACLFGTTWAQAQKELAHSAKIVYSKTVFFSNQTGSEAAGANALAEIKKWGKYRVVRDRKQADLILLLSTDPYHPGDDLSGNAKPNDLDDGEVSNIPKWDRQKPTRYAYLTVIDPKTGENLWSAEHIWGGLLTGFNSAGERLVKELEKQSKN